MKKICIILASLLGIALVIFLIARSNSFSHVLRAKGFDDTGAQILVRGFDPNENEYAIVKSSSKDQELVLIRMVKNDMGFWTVDSSRGTTSINPNLVSISWYGSGNFLRRFDVEETAIFETELHVMYYGNNAIKLIELSPDQIPENVTVNINQAGEVFWIHTITFSSEALNDFDLHDLLIENGSIVS